MNEQGPIIVKGSQIDDQTRCIHYHSALDIIAIKFRCCQTYYPCYDCHQAEADHAPQRWSEDEWHSKAILCGACKTELTIRQYFDCNYICLSCKAHFNPGCRNHDHLYFGESIC